jgi:hypothetical protein
VERTTMSAVAVETPIVSVGQPVFATACASDFKVHVLFSAELFGAPDKIRNINGSRRDHFPRAVYELDPWF